MVGIPPIFRVLKRPLKNFLANLLSESIEKTCKFLVGNQNSLPIAAWQDIVHNSWTYPLPRFTLLLSTTVVGSKPDEENSETVWGHQYLWICSDNHPEVDRIQNVQRYSYLRVFFFRFPCSIFSRMTLDVDDFPLKDSIKKSASSGDRNSCSRS